MKKLLISLAIVVLGVFIADRMGGAVMGWVNQNSSDISAPKIKYLANDVSEDLLLMGTSRCNFHYVPSILKDSLGMSVYNGGIDASDNIFAHYYILNQILSHHTPKIICLEVMTNDYAKQSDPFKTVSFFAPYFGRNDRADSIFRYAGTYWPYKLSHLYRYNAKAVSNLAGLLVNRQGGEDHGYLPGPKPASFPDRLEKAETPLKVDSMKLFYLHKFINLCRKKDIQLFFMVSPSYSIASEDLYDVLKKEASKYGIPFWDYHSQGLYLDHPEYFKDGSHLWDKGARLYTSIFAHDLKEWIEKEL
ncbi:MAG: hypothetical protein PHC95_14010 [Parabacteroides sp.]|nr:hypothetical protein [Parabacteroides sp.]